ncbi:hypothetical protein HPB47_021349 [Ixodes persulcatus]|uniref:Uncharacterized protein n=1 Tax=Ixodes persulcatus TaxID=34615 RepID=A0AC60QCU1_IXOPE|nr:hypothetical protein HPB47_021349 [Ixodes persulcatus]
MGGVDPLDMLVALYRTTLRSKKCYLKLFFHLIDVVVNHFGLLGRRLDIEPGSHREAQENLEGESAEGQNSTYTMTSYLSAPTNSCKGVIHGVPALIPSDQIIAHIESEAPVITARMMGKTVMALITFQETYVPFTIY